MRHYNADLFNTTRIRDPLGLFDTDPHENLVISPPSIVATAVPEPVDILALTFPLVRRFVAGQDQESIWLERSLLPGIVTRNEDSYLVVGARLNITIIFAQGTRFEFTIRYGGQITSINATRTFFGGGFARGLSNDDGFQLRVLWDGQGSDGSLFDSPNPAYGVTGELIPIELV